MSKVAKKGNILVIFCDNADKETVPPQSHCERNAKKVLGAEYRALFHQNGVFAVSLLESGTSFVSSSTYTLCGIATVLYCEA